MLFNSYGFIFLFLPITFFVYFYLNSKKLTEASKGFLVLSSLFFYSWWNIIYLPLILVSMVFNYVIGTSIAKDEGHKKVSKKQLLIVGVIGNVGLLGYFKYTDFFIKNINLVSGSEIPLLHLALPLAISFFTFQQIAYLVDSYKGETKEYDFLNYGVFVTFFPQLIAGPIVHHKEMMPQFASVRNKVKNYKNIALGLFIFSIGLFKKVAIADTFAQWATPGFDYTQTLTFFEAWATSLSYTFQLYFDFSGYTDMAIGAALLFNIKLPINFNSPYKSTNIQAFWRRWHITLSRFLKDYIYIPLGGNRKGNFRTYNNLMATFLIAGLWHGAGWTFVFWGGLHGLALVIHRIWSQLGFRLNAVVGWIITFNFINVAWVFFRAKDWDHAVKVVKGMVDVSHIVVSKQFADFVNYINPFSNDYPKLNGIELHTFISIYTFEMILFGFASTLLLKNSNSYLEHFRYSLKNLFFIIFSVVVFHFIQRTYAESIFLYFNF